MTSEDDDYVSMHHRLRRTLRKRLKHVSAEAEKPVTDLINLAIEQCLARHESIPNNHTDLSKMSASDRVSELRAACQSGTYFERVMACNKNELVRVAQSLGANVDLRASTDRLANTIKVLVE